jgi:hypothetical protein
MKGSFRNTRDALVRRVARASRLPCCAFRAAHQVSIGFLNANARRVYSAGREIRLARRPRYPRRAVLLSVRIQAQKVAEGSGFRFASGNPDTLHPTPDSLLIFCAHLCPVISARQYKICPRHAAIPRIRAAEDTRSPRLRAPFFAEVFSRFFLDAIRHIHLHTKMPRRSQRTEVAIWMKTGGRHV